MLFLRVRTGRVGIGLGTSDAVCIAQGLPGCRSTPDEKRYFLHKLLILFISPCKMEFFDFGGERITFLFPTTLSGRP